MPKAYAILLLLAAPGTPGFCQSPAGLPPDFASFDQYALRAPETERKTLERLTAYLVKPYRSEPEKVRSIYAWIVCNIRYDHRLAARKRWKNPSPGTIL
ncbi:MAG TPA: hypothetical protein VF646_04595, partial [Cytophagales bacterium]